MDLEEKASKGDRNPKDFILFFASDFAVQSVAKDNTGIRGVFRNGEVFPTLSFPSDHAITSTSLLPLSSESLENNNLRVKNKEKIY